MTDSPAPLSPLEREILRTCWERGDVSGYPKDIVDGLVSRCLLLWNSPAFIPKRSASTTRSGREAMERESATEASK